jgi:hypothetical protein
MVVGPTGSSTADQRAPPPYGKAPIEESPGRLTWADRLSPDIEAGE